MPDPLTNEQLHRIRAFLRENSTLALATVNARGEPEAAPVFYVSDDALKLYWLSSPTSRHSVNLTAQPSVAATIYPAVWDWREIRGLQIEGRAGTVEDAGQREAILNAYRAKFDLPPELAPQIAASVLYALTPRWIRWLDNGIRMGYKAELSAADEQHTAGS